MDEVLKNIDKVIEATQVEKRGNPNIKNFGFSASRQPTNEQLQKGNIKRKKGGELIKALFELAYKKAHIGDELAHECSSYFNLPVNDITVEIMLHFKQIKKAIETGDTFAYVTLMNRAYGMPKSNVKLSGDNDNPVILEGRSQLDVSKLPIDTIKQLYLAMNNSNTQTNSNIIEINGEVQTNEDNNDNEQTNIELIDNDGLNIDDL